MSAKYDQRANQREVQKQGFQEERSVIGALLIRHFPPVVAIFIDSSFIDHGGSGFLHARGRPDGGVQRDYGQDGRGESVLGQPDGGFQPVSSAHRKPDSDNKI